MPELETNVLHYGDNLEILRRYRPDASVDLIYLDPPFSSNRLYNGISRWDWGPSAESTYRYLANTAHPQCPC